MHIDTTNIYVPQRCPSYSIPPIHPDDVPTLLEKVDKRVNIAKEKAEKEAEDR